MNSPIILDFAIECDDATEIPFKYDCQLGMNILDDQESKVIFIDTKYESLDSMTKTKIVNETDDSPPSHFDGLTKSKVSNGAGSQFFRRDITTKTLVSNESDD